MEQRKGYTVHESCFRRMDSYRHDDGVVRCLYHPCLAQFLCRVESQVCHTITLSLFLLGIIDSVVYGVVCAGIFTRWLSRRSGVLVCVVIYCSIDVRIVYKNLTTSKLHAGYF